MNSTFIIGMAGGSGSGKTTFLRALLSHFTTDEVALISQDNYYKPKHRQQADENGVLNFDLPTSIDRQHFFSDMQSLVQGRAIEKKEYNFNNPKWEPQQIIVHPAPVIIMEGLFIFHFAEVMNHLQYKVYLDAENDQRLQRRIKRDGEERGLAPDAVRYQWHNHVLPAEEKYLKPYLAGCDLHIDNTLHFNDGLQQLIKIIRAKLEP